MIDTKNKAQCRTMCGMQHHAVAKITHVIIVTKPVQLGQRCHDKRRGDMDRFFVDLASNMAHGLWKTGAITRISEHATYNEEMLSWRNNETRKAAAIPMTDKT